MTADPLFWSRFIQTAEPLYLTRSLRFRDEYRDQLLESMNLTDGMHILEAGCGPGLLCHRLGEWLPQSRITGLDPDKGFIMHARLRDAPVMNKRQFLQGDALSFPFRADSFDAVTSHTVIEHLDNRRFISEQFRVCRPGGTISVLSSRPEASINPESWQRISRAEKELWETYRARSAISVTDREVGSHQPDIGDIPRLLEEVGCAGVHVTFLAITLAPDNAGLSGIQKAAYVDAERQVALDTIVLASRRNPGVWTKDEVLFLRDKTEERYAARMKAMERGERMWDISVSMLMIAAGKKP